MPTYEAIMTARYLDSLNHRLNEAMEKIQEHLPVEDIEYDQQGKPVYRCCWPLVKILIEMKETAKLLTEPTQPRRDDTDDRYNVDWSRIPANGEYHR